MTRTLLFDADVLAYRFGHAATETYDFGDVTAEVEDLNAALDMANLYVEEVVEECGGDDVVLCWSDPEDGKNWRLAVLPTYKHNRNPLSRPSLYYPLREQLFSMYRSYSRPTLEADDVLGILMTRPYPTPDQKVCVTIDKDLLQVPGWHYNPTTGARKRVTKADGDYMHMLQTLAGDAVDGYDGIPGIGMKKAEKILAPAKGDLSCMWELVVRAYIESGQFPEDSEGAALVNARVAKILQAEDYNLKERKPRLWNPPT